VIAASHYLPSKCGHFTDLICFWQTDAVRILGMKARGWLVFLMALICVAGVVVGWVWWQSDNQGFSRSSAPSTGPITQVHRHSSAGDLQVASDDRSTEEQRYHADLQDRVDLIIRAAATSDEETVARSERTLPTAALPLLRDAIMAGNLPSATTRPVGDALDHDAVRLRNALATQKRLDWYHIHLLNVFEKYSGDKPWTVPARAAVQAAARLWSDDPRSTEDEDMIIWREGYTAWKDKCSEPLAILAWSRALVRLNSDDHQWICKAAINAQENISPSDYPLAFKMAADFWAAQALSRFGPTTIENKKQIDRLIDQGKSLFPKVIADPDLPHQQIQFIFNMLSDVSVSVYGDRRTLPAPLFDELKKSRIAPSLALQVQGKFNKDYAWDSRGNGWANSVTEQGWQLFEQRLAKAAASLEQSWKLDPTDSDTAVIMIDVELGQGQGRDRMELWFNRAMEANPDNYWACTEKLYYLQPKWYGTDEEMLKFGHECVAGGNWDAGIPYILVEAHHDVSHYDANGWQQAEQKGYFENNPQAWDEIRSVYAEDRKHRPRSVYKELEFARMAEWTSHWSEANQMFDEVGDAYNTNVYPIAEQKKARAEAKRHVLATTQPVRF
jgi:hypothetical protein